MPSLMELATSYYLAGGFTVQRATDGLLDLVRDKATGRERILLFVDEQIYAAAREMSQAEREARDTRDEALLETFRREMASAPGAVGYFLVNSRRGFSQRLGQEAVTLLAGGGVRVPAELFDTAYKYEGAKSGATPFKHVIEQAKAFRRVAQPFLVRRGVGKEDVTPGGADLVEHLETLVADPETRPKLRFIDGAAGGGKTIAFNALVAKLYPEFIEAKQGRQQRRRPIVFLPEHLRGTAEVGHVADIVAAVVATDFAESVTPDQLEWLLINGFSLWMFDGLDEFYGGDTDFFPFVERMLAAPGRQAQILICSRDSLLSSSARTRAFLERQIAAGHDVEIFELSPWGPAAWREIAWLELERGRSGAESSTRVNAFVAALEASPEIADLARLPFYCTVLLERFKEEGGLLDKGSSFGRLIGRKSRDVVDEFDLMEIIVERMVDREHAKALFSWQDFADFVAHTDATVEQRDAVAAMKIRDEQLKTRTESILDRMLADEGRENLLDMLGFFAHWSRRTPDAGQPSGTMLTEALSSSFQTRHALADIADPAAQRLLIVLVQFAFFGQGRRSGSVDFAHPILADYLAARYATAMLSTEVTSPARATQTVRQAIGTADIKPGSLFHRFLVREMQREPLIREMLETALALGRLERANVVDGVRLLLTGA